MFDLYKTTTTSTKIVYISLKSNIIPFENALPHISMEPQRGLTTENEGECGDEKIDDQTIYVCIKIAIYIEYLSRITHIYNPIISTNTRGLNIISHK